MAWQEIIGTALHHLRWERRLTQQEVATAVHMHVTDLSRLERGQRPQIPFATVLRLAQYYGVTLDELYLADALDCSLDELVGRSRNGEDRM